MTFLFFPGSFIQFPYKYKICVYGYYRFLLVKPESFSEYQVGGTPACIWTIL